MHDANATGKSTDDSQKEQNNLKSDQKEVELKPNKNIKAPTYQRLTEGYDPSAWKKTEKK